MEFVFSGLTKLTKSFRPPIKSRINIPMTLTRTVIKIDKTELKGVDYFPLIIDLLQDKNSTEI